MFTLYEFPSSGNCYKLRLAMSQLDIPFNRVTIDITKGESRTEDFLKINPNGRIPVLQIPEGDCIPESNAALWYLASGSALLPTGRLEQAKALQWMFFEQYSHEPFIATSRYWVKILGAAEKYRVQLQEKQGPGYAALAVMDKHLQENEYFAGEHYSVADIALYPYTHVAHEGGFDLEPYPAVRDWLKRVESTPGYVSMSA